MRKRFWIGLAVVLGWMVGQGAWGQSVKVSWGKEEMPSAATIKGGRIVLFMIRPGAKVGRREDPIDIPFEREPQPIFGANLTELTPETDGGYVLDDTTRGFLGSGLGEKGRGTLRDLPSGSYRLQAALIVNRERDWRECAGNLYSAEVKFEVSPGSRVEVRLTEKTEVRPWPGAAGTLGAEEFVIRSEKLSKFWGREVKLRAGVRFPTGYDRTRKYPVVYEIPGFGGDHFAALGPRGRGADGQKLAANSFYIVLDPNSPYGHTFFMNSDTIGPWADALIEELLPALEAKYPLIPKPEARLLRGHSSGGWSTLWLATEYPHVFGATWSTSPDPVDFRRFELVNIYERENFFKDSSGETPSARIGGGMVTQTIREENAVEDVLGPGWSSAQQWASWLACWGTRSPNGKPTSLFDPVTGQINKAEAQTYRRYDLGERLRKEPNRFVPIFRNNIRLACGTQDDYYLEEAVILLKEELEKQDPQGTGPGYIKLIEGATHGSIYNSPELRQFTSEMLTHLRGAGVEVR